MSFDYAEMTTRNLGFVNDAEQLALRNGRVFVVGTGGMGGACIQSLARAGVGAFDIADFDTFEVSNLNRQVFANLDTVGVDKAKATETALGKINPDMDLKVHGEAWPDSIDDILSRCKVVVNGMDDLKAGLLLYRKAREHGATVIDAYTSPLPSVTVVRPTDPRPEERLKFPTLGIPWQDVSEEQEDDCKVRELEYVMANSSSSKAIHMDIAMEMFTGDRPRMSFAPMVITTGNLMAYEAVKLLLGKATTDYRGFFYQPWTNKVEKPWGPVMGPIVGFLARRAIAKLLG